MIYVLIIVNILRILHIFVYLLYLSHMFYKLLNQDILDIYIIWHLYILIILLYFLLFLLYILLFEFPNIQINNIFLPWTTWPIVPIVTVACRLIISGVNWVIFVESNNVSNDSIAKFFDLENNLLISSSFCGIDLYFSKISLLDI